MADLLANKRTIMVVDDDPEIVKVLRAILERSDFNVICVYSGLEIFANLAEQRPDLILLDIMMPQMDGLEALTRLKEDPETASIPVILLTAKVQYDDILGGYKMGADYYLTKPFTNAQLLTGINILLTRPDTPPSSSIDSG
jgi:CheY-like chemotaxis protein